MTQIDEFESLFKSADKPVFHVQPLRIQKILLVTDDQIADSEQFTSAVTKFISVVADPEQPLEVHLIGPSEYHSVQDLVTQVVQFSPDLVCTYRNLRMPIEDHPFSLGVYIDVLTQATNFPILLLPRPDQISKPDALGPTTHVMAVTDHLAGDQKLVSYAARFTQPNGTLALVHIEDEVIFERYIAVIGKIPTLDTDVAREEIKAKLLREPQDYIDSCRNEIQKLKLPLSVQSIVTMGHWLSDYKRLIESQQTRLLVLNTKDDDQLAMHGMGYPLSIEIQDIPLLLI